MAGGTEAERHLLLEQLALGEPIRINCGGEEYLNHEGKVWSKDRFFTSGDIYWWGEQTFSTEIANTDDDPLYQTERFFSPEYRPAIEYRLPLPPGEYRVTLHFAEIARKKLGERVFTILVEGKPFLEDLENYDIYAKVGSATPDVYLDTCSVTDGSLDIDFVNQEENPKISALEIERVDRR